MHDAAYKQLFSRPRMVRDLLEGFAAPGSSGKLDFDTLEPLPASYVSRDLQQRHGDLVWRLAGVTEPERLAQVGDRIIECATAADLIARVLDEGRLDD